MSMIVVKNCPIGAHTLRKEYDEERSLMLYICEIHDKVCQVMPFAFPEVFQACPHLDALLATLLGGPILADFEDGYCNKFHCSEHDVAFWLSGVNRGLEALGEFSDGIFWHWVDKRNNNGTTTYGWLIDAEEPC